MGINGPYPRNRGGILMADLVVRISDLEALSRRVAENNQNLERLTADIERSVTNAKWEGRAAAKFKTSWGEQRENLKRMSTTLTDVKKNIDEFKQAYSTLEQV
jgi:uncharacterized protein YukE